MPAEIAKGFHGLPSKGTLSRETDKPCWACQCRVGILVQYFAYFK